MNLAIENADERTRQLADHIYHIVTFSPFHYAVLCIYKVNLIVAKYDVASLDNPVVRFVEWSRSIELPCRATHMLTSIPAA